MQLIGVDLESALPEVPAATTGEQWVLVRLHGEPMGVLRLPTGRACSAEDLADLIAVRCGDAVCRHRLLDRLVPGACLRAAPASALPSLTVVVCTRDRTDSLRACLASLASLEYADGRLHVLVVDNAPSDGATAGLVGESFPRFRYVREPRPGLNWARNRGVLDARGEIVAFADDDVVVEPGWAKAIGAAFTREPDAMAVTGLVVPAETGTDAQLHFERYGGFGRGLTRRYFQIDASERAAHVHGGTGKFGTGANMAFRRCLFDEVGLFDPALDVGTPANGGGDLDMFFRVIKHGHLLVYEPGAIVRHTHRRTPEALREQIANNGVGFYTYLSRAAAAYPDERTALMRLGARWFWQWNVRRLFASLVRRPEIPRRLVVAELTGSIRGMFRYRAARARAASVLARFGPQAPSGDPA